MLDSNSMEAAEEEGEIMLPGSPDESEEDEENDEAGFAKTTRMTNRELHCFKHPRSKPNTTNSPDHKYCLVGITNAAFEVGADLAEVYKAMRAVAPARK